MDALDYITNRPALQNAALASGQQAMAQNQMPLAMQQYAQNPNNAQAYQTLALANPEYAKNLAMQQNQQFNQNQTAQNNALNRENMGYQNQRAKLDSATKKQAFDQQFAATVYQNVSQLPPEQQQAAYDAFKEKHKAMTGEDMVDAHMQEMNDWNVAKPVLAQNYAAMNPGKVEIKDDRAVTFDNKGNITGVVGLPVTPTKEAEFGAKNNQLTDEQKNVRDLWNMTPEQRAIAGPVMTKHSLVNVNNGVVTNPDGTTTIPNASSPLAAGSGGGHGGGSRSGLSNESIGKQQEKVTASSGALNQAVQADQLAQPWALTVQGKVYNMGTSALDAIGVSTKEQQKDISKSTAFTSTLGLIGDTFVHDMTGAGFSDKQKEAYLKNVPSVSDTPTQFATKNAMMILNSARASATAKAVISAGNSVGSPAYVRQMAQLGIPADNPFAFVAKGLPDNFEDTVKIMYDEGVPMPIAYKTAKIVMDIREKSK